MTKEKEEEVREDEPEVNRAKKAFLPYMRHELRTPINAILGYSEMLLEDTAEKGDSAKDLRSDLETIHAAGSELLALVNNTQTDFDLEAFGTSFRHAIRTMINTVVGYSEMLLEDAEEHSGEDFMGDLMKIQMAGKQLFTLIEEFVNLGKIEAGKADIDLAVSQASPMLQEAVTSIPALPEDSKTSAEGLGGYILIVDDNELNRDLLSRHLDRQGYTSALAENGRQALEMIPKQKFDLVLLDIMMPELNGYEVLQTLKADPHLRDIPVIMISALDEIDSVVRCLEIGAEDYLSKPFNPTLLKARIGAIVEKKRLHDREAQLFDELQKNYQRLEEKATTERQLRERLAKELSEVERRERDLAEARKELQIAYNELKQLDEMKDSFISTVSHELRTPLTSVLGFAKIIRKRLDDVIFPLVKTSDKKVERAVRQVRDDIGIIISEGERLTGLINDVLDLAKMEAGKIDWKMDAISIGEIIDRATAATISLFEQKGLQLIKEVEEELPDIIGDKDRLIQVMINLISNSVKFTEKGSVTCQAGKLGDKIVVNVIDTGIGIAKEDQEKVFEKFRQIGDTLTDKPKGTGLGLPICKQIVDHHGGKIWVESEPGRGSKFLFTLNTMEKAGGATGWHDDAKGESKCS